MSPTKAQIYTKRPPKKMLPELCTPNTSSGTNSLRRQKQPWHKNGRGMVEKRLRALPHSSAPANAPTNPPRDGGPVDCPNRPRILYPPFCTPSRLGANEGEYLRSSFHVRVKRLGGCNPQYTMLVLRIGEWGHRTRIALCPPTPFRCLTPAGSWGHSTSDASIHPPPLQQQNSCTRRQ